MQFVPSGPLWPVVIHRQRSLYSVHGDDRPPAPSTARTLPWRGVVSVRHSERPACPSPRSMDVLGARAHVFSARRRGT